MLKFLIYFLFSISAYDLDNCVMDEFLKAKYIHMFLDNQQLYYMVEKLLLSF